MSDDVLKVLIGVLGSIALAIVTPLLAAVVVKLNAIHTVVNSRLTEALAAVDSLKAEVSRLNTSIGGKGVSVPTTQTSAAADVTITPEGSVMVAKKPS